MSSGYEICKSEWDTYDIFISCFGCTSLYHAKRAKIKPTVGDVERGIETNGLQWYCPKNVTCSPAQ